MKIMFLRESVMKGSSVIGAYHTMRVVPLMARVLPFHLIVPDASLEWTVHAEGEFPNSKITQRIKEVLEPSKDDMGSVLDFVYPVLGHPLM